MTKPHFIVIGAQKSASTFVQNCLGDHPEIYLPHGEIPYFESPDYEEAAEPPWSKLFAGRTEKILGFKRPNYIGKPEVPPRITADLPEIRLIAVLRNPIDRIIAAYFHQIKYGTLPAVPLEEGLPEILDGGPLASRYPRARELVEFGLYAKHLKTYESFMADGRLKILLHEDIAREPGAQIRQCYSFLGADDSFSPSTLHSRPQKVAYSIPRLKFLGLRNRFLHGYNHDKTRVWRKRMNAVEWSLVAAITGFDRIFLSLIGTRKPAPSPELHRRLVDIYKDDIAALETMIVRDLSHWLHAPKDAPSIRPSN
ncbi:sulfotransferase domain-containing protein [Vannielia litorea]|uniref:sulfotransferase domain-containing protein n=1 Tax=Vannielia litorea TaxID=1217970 RepID=UPI001BCD002D|nr:sulfotransferase domain-containing protein [Vannielia litorea]MBS8228120.1 hypothetical protein [Vannielia litorea]